MINIDSIKYGYKRDNLILDKIKFDIEEGEFIAILGNNGAGKSTLLKCLNRIIHPNEGKVIIENQDILCLSQKEIAKKVAYVAQKNESSKFTVYDTVLLGRKPYIKYSITKNDYKIVDEIIASMKLEDYKLRYIDELSGGELQKVMLARALAQKPKMLLLDEPTSNLDLKNQLEVLQIMKNAAKENNIAIIIVIHDLNLAVRYCDKFIFLKDRHILNYGDLDIINEENIKKVYDVNVQIENVNNKKIIIPLT
ncbi:MAG: ABC transporter related protein [Intestinibacter bartlettii DORA_8_9]|uniref:Putative siderophore transport system ATP-binding protein YusV n=1 Tax=Intestinibacter bartlettii TaxID=261299 RepID=A0A6N3C6I9_9FIRM|nr:MAG: ABC transporter related protein [Intestinibacter bartlettii DORA_8_9]